MPIVILFNGDNEVNPDLSSNARQSFSLEDLRLELKQYFST